MKPRKIPTRMCIGCQQMKPKRELVRVVRTPTGELLVDDTGKTSGRGAYICPDPACLQAALKGKRLQKALETDLPPEIVQVLQDKINQETKVKT